jgi:hypothetical protein
MKGRKMVGDIINESCEDFARPSNFFSQLYAWRRRDPRHQQVLLMAHGFLPIGVSIAFSFLQAPVEGTQHRTLERSEIETGMILTRRRKKCPAMRLTNRLRRGSLLSSLQHYSMRSLMTMTTVFLLGSRKDHRTDPAPVDRSPTPLERPVTVLLSSCAASLPLPFGFPV